MEIRARALSLKLENEPALRNSHAQGLAPMAARPNTASSSQAQSYGAPVPPRSQRPQPHCSRAWAPGGCHARRTVVIRVALSAAVLALSVEITQCAKPELAPGGRFLIMTKISYFLWHVERAFPSRVLGKTDAKTAVQTWLFKMWEGRQGATRRGRSERASY